MYLPRTRRKFDPECLSGFGRTYVSGSETRRQYPNVPVAVSATAERAIQARLVSADVSTFWEPLTSPIHPAQRLTYPAAQADSGIALATRQSVLKRSSPGTTRTPTNFGFYTASPKSLHRQLLFPHDSMPGLEYRCMRFQVIAFVFLFAANTAFAQPPSPIARCEKLFVNDTIIRIGFSEPDTSKQLRAAGITEKGLSRRSFLIGSSAILAPLVLPSSNAIRALSRESASSSSHLWLSGSPGLGKAETLHLLTKGSDFTYKFVDLSNPDFLNNVGQAVRSELPSGRVLGAISQGQSVSLDGQLVFAEEPLIKRQLGWQSLRILNAAGGVVNSLVRIVSSKGFNSFVDLFSQGKIAHELEALNIIEQLEGSSIGSLPISVTTDVPRILIEDKEQF